jgi:hypothetical protein
MLNKKNMKIKNTLIVLGSVLILFQLYKIFKNTFNLNTDLKNMLKVEYIIYYISALIGYNIFALAGVILIIIAFKKKD